MDVFSKEIFCQVASQKIEQGTMENSLLYLIRMMRAHYGKPVILLIDEYDVPLAKASDNGYYREMLDVMNGIIQAVKDNTSLKFAVITRRLSGPAKSGKQIEIYRKSENSQITKNANKNCQII